MNKELLKKIIYDQHQVIKHCVIVDRDITLEKKANYVLVGLRRAGKTTLLYKRVQDLIREGVEWNQIIYINFEDERLVGFTREDFDDILLVAEELSDKEHYFYFDEIQNIEGWEKFAIRIANQGYKADITGSNATMLSKEVEARLGGRYISKEVLPYSFKEYLRACGVNPHSYANKDIAKVNNLLEQYYVFGGFPETLNFINKREYLSSLYQKVLYGDIIAHYKVRNENGMKLLVKKLSESVMQDISYSKLQNVIAGIGYKISKEIIMDYCDYCQESFLVFKMENFYASFVNKSSYPKFYFRDNGVLSLFVDEKKASLLENMVAINLYRNNEEVYYLKGNKTDVDFYVPDKNLLVQAAYSLKEYDSYDREVNSLIEYAKSSKEPSRLMIVTHDEKEEIEKDGYRIEVVPLKDFLLRSQLPTT